MLIIGSGILQIYINNDIISAYNYYQTATIQSHKCFGTSLCVKLLKS